MILAAQPLLNEDGDEQGGEGKINSGEIHWEISRQRAQNRAQDPVALVKQGDEKAVADSLHILRQFPGNKGIGFIRQGENQIGLPPPGAFVGLDHGEPIEQVAGVHHQCGQGGGEKTGTAGEQADAHILHGTGVDKQAHGQCPQRAVAILLQNDSETYPQKQVACHDGEGIPKGFFYGLLLHMCSLSLARFSCWLVRWMEEMTGSAARPSRKC